MINQKEITMLIKKLELKHQCINLCDFSDAYIVVKGNITVVKKTFTANDFEAPNNTAANANATNTANNNAFGKKSQFLKIMHHLLIVFQKLIA